MAKASSTSLDIIPMAPDSEQFAIMAAGNRDIKSVLQANLGSDELRPEDLERVVVPGSGGTTWQINTVDGIVDTRELVGVIVHTQICRARWEKPFDEGGGGAPPDCVSRDGQLGVGDPGGDCLSCPFNQFESDAKGRGKACQESRQVFLVLQNEILPIVVKAPATSLKNAKKYLLGLTSRNKPVHAVFTKLTLETEKNPEGIKYSKIVFSKVGDVENPEATAAYAAAIKPYLQSIAETMADEPNGYSS